MQESPAGVRLMLFLRNHLSNSHSEPNSAMQYFKISSDSSKSFEHLTNTLVKHKDVQGLLRVERPMFRSPELSIKDVWISMEDYYLDQILAWEKNPESADRPKLIQESPVTLSESVEWTANSNSLFKAHFEQGHFLSGMQLGYASSCSKISLKFREGPNHLDEIRMNGEFTEFSKEVYQPTIRTSAGQFSQCFNIIFHDKYPYRVYGREHLLKRGLMVAVLGMCPNIFTDFQGNFIKIL